MSISFEKKIPKKRMVMKRNPYIVILNDKDGGVMEPAKKLSNKRLRREHRKSIRQGSYETE